MTPADRAPSPDGTPSTKTVLGDFSVPEDADFTPGSDDEGHEELPGETDRA